MTSTWDPDLYARFQGPRFRPGLELRDRIPHPRPKSVVDLGCGSGTLTLALAVHWPQARVHGVDHSPQMLERARELDGRLPAGHELTWEQADVARWTPQAPVDVLFSNACLHWLPNHEELLPRFMGFLAPGGALAVQLPTSHREPSHRLMREVLEAEGLGDDGLHAQLERAWVLDPAAYLDLLTPHARRVDVWETRYHQVLEGENAVLEWVRATGLRPVLEALDEEEQERFLVPYAAALRRAYPPRTNGTTVYPFPRLFFVAEAR
jgi:trans-aconitate 2-methyltransferase